MKDIKRKTVGLFRSRLLQVTITVALGIALFTVMSGYGGGGLPPGKDGRPAPAAQQGGVFADVPINHWAHADIQFLVERGIIIGLPGGRFNGAQPLDRFSAAALTARTVRYLKNYPRGVTPREDLDVVKNLVLNVADHISVMQREIEALRAGAGTAALENRIARNEAQLTALTQRIQALEAVPAHDEELAQQVQTSLIVGATGIIVGIVGIVLWLVMPGGP
ncbi:S-layer homology domain-containing protein [Candidatus Acetothermia bacterium]|jgi:hypothetical protein|nr:S-layer homology domain-containing protein [Candidatus Acetothermia bacterium]MCI2427172.1 S-layer homology domain-containing protein [Candidatus Acetothermia bacterium]MCI2428068.1 S-layer homology domain-containing protein [Candidatus Acetothermia bacterium]